MAEEKKYNIRLTATDETHAAFESAKRGLEEMDGPLKNIKNLMSGLGESLIVAGVMEFAKSLADAAEESIQAQLKLEAVYKTTGGVVGYTADALNKMADAIANVTHFDDEEIRNGMAEIIKFGNITGAVFKDSLKVIADYATFSKQDFQSASMEIAKALAGPEYAAKVLKQAGVILTEQQKELIQSLKDVGDEAGAQRVILERLKDTYGGMESALNVGLTGATSSFKKEWHELLEELGKSSGSVGPAKIVLTDFSDTFKLLREQITKLDDQYKNSLFFNRGKGAPLVLEETPDAQDKGPLAGKTIADVQAVNNAIAAAQKAADDAAAATAKTALDKLLAQVKKFDEETLASHDDAFTKWLNHWKELEDELTAAGAAGTAKRKAHEAAYTVHVNAENKKRQADADTAEKIKAAHLAVEVGKENEYFAKIHAMAQDATTSSIGREKLRYDREVLDLQKRRALATKDHQLSLAEEMAFHQAELDLKTDHQAKLITLKDDSDRKIVEGEIRWKKISMDSMASAFGAAKGLMNSHSRAAFAIGKAAAISENAINTTKSAMAAYSAMAGIPYVGPALGVLAAAAAITAGLAQDSAIKSTSFGSSGSGGGSFGGATSSLNGGQATPNYPSTPAPAPTSPTQNQSPPVTIYVYITGNVLSSDFVENTVIPQLKNQIANSDVLIIDPRSRQAQVLANA